MQLDVAGLMARFTAMAPAADPITAGLKLANSGADALLGLAKKFQQGTASEGDILNALVKLMGSMAQMGGPQAGASVASQPGVWTEEAPSASASGSGSGSSDVQGTGVAGSLDARIQAGWNDLYSKVQTIGDSIQKLQDDAMKLANSSKPGDQAKANMMMKQAEMMFEALKNMIDAIGRMGKSAIQAAGQSN